MKNKDEAVLNELLMMTLKHGSKKEKTLTEPNIVKRYLKTLNIDKEKAIKDANDEVDKQYLKNTFDDGNVFGCNGVYKYDNEKFLGR